LKEQETFEVKYHYLNIEQSIKWREEISKEYDEINVRECILLQKDKKGLID
jgi:hypothetical protein